MAITYTPLDISKLGGGEVFLNQSVGSKESEPLSKTPKEISFESGFEHTPSAEISSYVDSRQDVAYVSDDLKDIGVSPVDSTHFRNFESVTLPLNDEKIDEGLKKPIDSSFRWFAELAKSIFLRKTRTA